MREKLKKYLPWIILVLVVVGLFTWYFLSRRITESQRNEYMGEMNEAEVNLNAQEYSTAINKYYDATAIIPTDVRAYEGIVKIFLLKNRVDDAISIVRQSTKPLSSNDRSNLYKSIGDYYYSQKEYESAKTMYQEGLGLGVSNSTAELMLGKSLLNMGRVDDGKGQIEKNKYDGESAIEANLILAYIYGVNDVEKAKSQIGSMTPSSKWSPFYDEYDKVLKSLDDDKKFNVVKLARVYINNGYPHLALTVLKNAEADISEYLEGVFYLGRAYLDTREYGKSLESFDKALTLGGMELQIFWNKARAYYLSNDLENAVISYSRALEYGGKNAPEELVKEYVTLLLESKQNLRAADVVKYVLTYAEKPYIYLLGIRGNYELGEKAKIEYYIKQLDKLELNDEEKKEQLYWEAKMALESDNLEGAKSFLNTLFSLDKYNPSYYLLLGMQKVKEMDNEAAKQALEKSIEYDLSGKVGEEANKLLSNIK